MFQNVNIFVVYFSLNHLYKSGHRRSLYKGQQSLSTVLELTYLFIFPTLHCML